MDNNQLAPSETIEEHEQTEVNQPETVEETPQGQEVVGFTAEQIANMSEEDFAKNEHLIQQQLLDAQQQESPSDVSEVQPQPESNEPETPPANSGNEPQGTSIEDQMSAEEFRQLLTSTFTANGREVQVSDPNDIRRLMQMGLNYQKKMAGLKPYKRIIASLEQNGLIDEGKLNYAIELIKGDKKAIAQLLKEHSVDTYDLPDLDESPYQPNDHLPSQYKVAFDEVANELRESTDGSKALDYAMKLDDKSFAVVYQKPQMLQTLADHAHSGLMDDTLATLEREYALGKVPEDVKAIDAYAFVADQLMQQNPTKYQPSTYQPKVVGNNLNKSRGNSFQQPSAKIQAHIPQGGGIPSQGTPEINENYIAGLPFDELEKFGSWQQFLAANNVNIKGN